MLFTIRLCKDLELLFACTILVYDNFFNWYVVSNPTEKILIFFVKLPGVFKIILSRMVNALGLVIII